MSKKAEYQYEPADESFLVNDDPSLTPIRISLPSPPPLHLIDGYGLPPREQRFKRQQVPKKLQSLYQDVKDNLETVAANKSSYKVTLYKVQVAFWNRLKNAQEVYKDEIEWLKKIWWHRVHGYWFFNNGKPTYICGWHFMYVNFWQYTETKKSGDKFPEYRDRDRRWFLFNWYAYTCTETFKEIDRDGKAIKKGDIYEMQDIGRRLSYGTGNTKQRRAGETHKSLCIGHEMMTINEGGTAGIISYNNKNSEQHFREKLVPAWQRFPMFFMPYYDGSYAPSNNVRYRVPGTEVGNVGVNSVMNYAESGDGKSYDGSRLIFILTDEEGKCFGKGTKIRMYDGTIKNVEDIEKGDLVMGDDKTPRKIFSTTKGIGQLYEVKSKKWGSFICNDKHILSLYVSDRRLTSYGCKEKTFIDIDIDTYLSYPKKGTKTLMLYKKSVDYKESKHTIDPYVMGVFLGDGTHKATTITNIDEEIWNEINIFCKKNNMVLKKYNYKTMALTKKETLYELIYNNKTEKYKYLHEITDKYGITEARLRWALYKKNGLSKEFTIKKQSIESFVSLLKKEGVYGNKHIPESYLIDSEINRLDLLAGLIDTDGYRFIGNKKGYEIVQKRKDLAYQICDLANSLGFDSRVKNKVATMKRTDGSKYKCDVYKVVVYGNDLYRIPCRVKRKQYTKEECEILKNRNPIYSGFELIKKEKGEYYGFTTDGNRRFLLDNYVVVHNTTEYSVSARWDVLKECLSTGNGMQIHGLSIHPSTVEDINGDGAKSYKELANQSNFYIRNEATGRTTSGLFWQFYPAYDGLEGFVDSYGYSVIGDLNPWQKEEGFRIGADVYLKKERQQLLASGRPEDIDRYRSLCRKFPIQYADSWIGDYGGIGWDVLKIDAAIAELDRNREKLPRRGNFLGSPEEGVRFEDDPEGRWYLSQTLSPKDANRKQRKSIVDMVTGNYKLVYEPENKLKYTAGADPYKYAKKAQMKTTKMSGYSQGGGCVFWHRDTRIDPDSKLIESWESNRFVCTYLHRPLDPDEYGEDMIKMCVYFGAMMYPETNVDSLWRYFEKRGFDGYLKYDVDDKGRFKDRPGIYSMESNKQDMFGLMQKHINDHVLRERHPDLLTQMKDIAAIDDMTNFDLLTAALLALWGSGQRVNDLLDEFDDGLDLGVMTDIF